MDGIVASIINNWDPIDLFPCSPIDEYQLEIMLINKSLKESKEVEHLANDINEIFTRRFGDDVFTRGYNECFDIAFKILEELEKANK